MGFKKINENILYDIARAIRGKLGTGSYFHPHEFASAITEIQGEPNIEPKSIYANGVYSVSGDTDGFNPIVVAVPNTFSEADAGKVVSGASLVAQTPISFTSNGTYDTTQNNEVTVNVAGGGGTDTSDATLQSGSQMLSGYTAYARGSKYTGTIPMYNGSIDGGQGSVPSYDYYSGSYTLTPSTVAQAFPTAGKIMSEDLQLLSYSAGAEPYSGSYVITPSIVSQAFPTAGKLLSQDIQVEPYSIDFYSGSYTIIPSAEAFSVLTSGKTLLSDLTIQAYNPSERAYQGSYTIAPSTTQQVFSTSGKVMLSDLTVLPVSEVYMDGDSFTLNFSSAIEFHTSSHALLIEESAFANNPYLLSVEFNYASEIKSNAFYSCSYLSLAYFYRCSKVGMSAFEGCRRLYDIGIDDVSYIGEGAFRGCEYLSNVYFGSAISTIAQFAFENCENLSEIRVMNKTRVPAIGSTNVFDGTPFSLNNSSYAKIYVPSNLVNSYKGNSVWSNFSNCIVGYIDD